MVACFSLLCGEVALQCGCPGPSGEEGGLPSMTGVTSGNQNLVHTHAHFLENRYEHVRKESPLPMPNQPPDQSGCFVTTLTHLDYDLRVKSKFFQRDLWTKTKNVIKILVWCFFFSHWIHAPSDITGPLRDSTGSPLVKSWLGLFLLPPFGPLSHHLSFSQAFVT